MTAQTQPAGLRIAGWLRKSNEEAMAWREDAATAIELLHARVQDLEAQRQHALDIANTYRERIAELDGQIATEAARTAAEKLRADQMSQQHDTQAALNRAARELLAAQRAPLTGAQMASVCLSYRHDFGLLGKADRVALIAEGRRWERAFDKQRANGITREAK